VRVSPRRVVRSVVKRPPTGSRYSVIASSEIHEPHFGDARRRVQRHFDVTIVLEGSVRDLDHEQDVLRLGVGRAIGVCARHQQSHVGLGLGVFPEPDWVLHRDERATCDEAGQQAGQRPDAARMSRPDRAHLDDLPVEQLHAVVLMEHARPAHPVVLVDGEAACGERHAHTIGTPQEGEQGSDMVPG